VKSLVDVLSKVPNEVWIAVGAALFLWFVAWRVRASTSSGSGAHAVASFINRCFVLCFVGLFRLIEAACVSLFKGLGSGAENRGQAGWRAKEPTAKQKSFARSQGVPSGGTSRGGLSDSLADKTKTPRWD
jgi:hypothetical protein